MHLAFERVFGAKTRSRISNLKIRRAPNQVREPRQKTKTCFRSMTMRESAQFA